jgi:hypothetical protein
MNGVDAAIDRAKTATINVTPHAVLYNPYVATLRGRSKHRHPHPTNPTPTPTPTVPYPKEGVQKLCDKTSRAQGTTALGERKRKLGRNDPEIHC